MAATATQTAPGVYTVSVNGMTIPNVQQNNLGAYGITNVGTQQPNQTAITPQQTPPQQPVANSTTPNAPAATQIQQPQSPQAQQEPILPSQGTDLQPGSTGPNVQELQNWLVQMGYLTPQQLTGGQGTYGPQTTAAVAKLQQDLGINPGNYPGYYGPQTQSALQQKYQSFFNSVQGQQSPTQYPAQQISALNTQSTDPVFGSMLSSMAPILQSLGQVMNNINNPALTGVSLQNEYNQLAQANNLPGLQTQMLNMQNIMNGSEQDIRNEIATAGGGATDSQVMAMTAARNQVILKQYNALATQYSAATTNVQNMMQYSAQDQQTQLQKEQMSAGVAESIAGIEGQMTQLGLTMQQNATSAYQTAINNIGYQAFVNGFANNPSGLRQAQTSLFPGSAPGTFLTDPQWVADQQVKWQQTQALNAAKVYYSAYGTLPPGFFQQYGGALGIQPPGTQGASGGSSGGASGAAPYTGSTVIGGIDFGNMATGVGAYATDIGSEVSGVGRNYSTITGLWGNNPSSAQLSSYIANNDPNSPVTGQMITSAAQSANISPAILASLLANESGFGTKGVGAKTMNPGNVGNTGTASQSFDSWQAGTNAAAQQLARRSVGQYLSSSNPNVQDAYNLVTGNLAPSQLSKRGAAYNNTILPLANQISSALYGKPFDAVQAQASYSFDTSQKVQQMKSSLNYTIATLSDLKTLSANVQRSQITFGNSAGEWLQYSGSDPATVDFITRTNAAIDDVAAALGGGVSTNAKLEVAKSILDPTLSQQAFDSQVNTDIVAVASRLGFLNSQSGLQSNGATVVMNGPQGAQNVPYANISVFLQNGYTLSQ